MKFINVLAFILVIIGALNWGLWGFFQFDFVAWFSHGNTTWLARLIYAIIGLAGLWSLRLIPRCKHMCCDMEKCCSDKDKGHGGGCCKM
jgi:uncharacterized protein